MLKVFRQPDTAVTCQQVDENLEAYLDSALTTTQMSAFQAHINRCSSCQALLQQEQLQIRQLRREAQLNQRTLSPVESAEIQQNLYRRMRRNKKMENMKLVTRTLVTAVVILFAAFLFVRWQSDKAITAEPLAAPQVLDNQTPTAEAQPTSTAEATREVIVTPAATADLSLQADLVEPITIRLAVDGSDFDAYERLIEDFEAENPAITVELISQSRLLPQNSTSDLSPEERRLQLASGADVLILPLDGEAIQEGLRLELTPFMVADSSLSLEDFYPGLLENYQQDGRVWAIPQAVGFTVLVYNREIFDEANIPYPQASWSRDTFLNTALALTIREGDEVKQWGFLDKYVGLGSSLPGLVGPPLTTNGLTASPRFTDPEFIAGMEWYVDLFLTHQVAPYWVGDFDNLNDFLSQGFSLIQSNQVAMWTDSTVFLTNSFLPGGGKWGIVPLPGCAPANTNSISISTYTEHPAAAWQLLSFLSEQLVVGDFPEDLPQMPARRSVAEGFYEHEQVSESLANTLRQSAEGICPMPGITTVGVNEALITLNNILTQQILTGEQSVQDALLQAQQEAGN